jgi:hypothetical protein
VLRVLAAIGASNNDHNDFRIKLNSNLVLDTSTVHEIGGLNYSFRCGGYYPQ